MRENQTFSTNAAARKKILAFILWMLFNKKTDVTVIINKLESAYQAQKTCR
jgi:hypothetical protein